MSKSQLMRAGTQSVAVCKFKLPMFDPMQTTWDGDGGEMGMGVKWGWG